MKPSQEDINAFAEIKDLQPGKIPEICDRSHLEEDDFWFKIIKLI